MLQWLQSLKALSLRGFPTSFLPTVILDLLWTVVYILLAPFSEQIRVRDYSLPASGVKAGIGGRS